MQLKEYLLCSARNKEVQIRVIEGHFATSHSHVNHCIDMTAVKSELKMARAASKLLCADYDNTPVDTIITLERMKMVGAFLARDLAMTGINLNQNIAVITPEKLNGKVVLRDNFLPYVKDKRVLLLTASATTGMTVDDAMEGIKYYGGMPVGVATVFGGNLRLVDDVPVVKLFGVDDIPDYQSFSPADCPLCKSGHKVDAVVNSYGYSQIQK